MDKDFDAVALLNAVANVLTAFSFVIDFHWASAPEFISGKFDGRFFTDISFTNSKHDVFYEYDSLDEAADAAAMSDRYYNADVEYSVEGRVYMFNFSNDPNSNTYVFKTGFIEKLIYWDIDPKIVEIFQHCINSTT